ncbi:Pre-mRNA-processing factor 19 [Tyrophagus putrescentiae]|nr:Pre-mRNA-processing factor 19 [Tyrophagus putrescentiae]
MYFHCVLSNEIPENPVVSPSSGSVFERRLIVKYLEENGVDPVSGKDMTVDELIELKTAPIVKPKPPSATSIPALLKSLQDEWDSTMLHSFNLRQQLHITRQELSHALYQHDAACRVIARLTKELTAARDALATLKPKAPSSTPVKAEEVGGDSGVHSGEEGLSAEVTQIITNKAATLTAERKKRCKTVPEELVKPEKIREFKTTSSQTALHSVSVPGITALDICPTNSKKIVTGGNDHTAVIFDKEKEEIVTVLKGHSKKVNNVIYHPNGDNVITASLDSQIRVWDVAKSQTVQVVRAHESPVTSISLHATGSYILSTSNDEFWAFSDLSTGKALIKAGDQTTNHSLTAARFHPDGLIFGTGTSDSLIKIWDLKERTNVANFPGHIGAVSAMSFSENGYYLASAGEDPYIRLWDLRKLKNFKSIPLDDDYVVKDLCYDKTGNYLAVAGKDVRIYISKHWENIKTFVDHHSPVTGVRFAENASYICSTSLDRSLKIYSM